MKVKKTTLLIAAVLFSQIDLDSAGEEGRGAVVKTLAEFPGEVKYFEPTARGIYVLMDGQPLVLYNPDNGSSKAITSFRISYLLPVGWEGFNSTHYVRFGDLVAFTQASVAEVSGFYTLNTSSGEFTSYSVPVKEFMYGKRGSRVWELRRYGKWCYLVADWWEKGWFDLENGRWAKNNDLTPDAYSDPREDRSLKSLSPRQTDRLRALATEHEFPYLSGALLADRSGKVELWAFPPMRTAPSREGERFPTLVAVWPEDVMLLPYLDMLPKDIGIEHYKLNMARCSEHLVSAVQRTKDASVLLTMGIPRGEKATISFPDAISAIHVIDSSVLAATGRRIVEVRLASAGTTVGTSSAK